MLAEMLIATVTVAFPKEGQHLPSVSRCYAIGATDGAERHLMIQGRSVPVFEGGGWVTMLDVVPGENTVDVGGQTLSFVVDPPPKDLSSSETKKTYSKLEYAADRPKAWVPGRQPSEFVIVLDAGHGGDDLGAVSPHGRPEKEVNLFVVKDVAEVLRQKGVQVVLTRDHDVAVPLYDRPKVAHAVGADAFVSIHHNAPPCNRDPREFRYHSVYAWNDLGQELASAINVRMAAGFGKTLKDNGVEHANFAVTRNPEIPSCLVEVDFITTPESEEDCWDSERRRMVATKIAEGILDWTKKR